MRQARKTKPPARRPQQRTLDTRELEWLVDGMGASRTSSLPERGPNGETYEISGVILGRLVKLQLTEGRYADLNAARRLAGVS